MLAAFLLTFREGIEAAVVVAIVLSVLTRLGRADMTKAAWAGVGAGVATSLVAGGLLLAFAGGLEGTAEKVFEGAAMFFAVGVLTYMIFWMARQGRSLADELVDKTNVAAAGGSLAALFGLTFIAIVREGLETALFLYSALGVSNVASVLVGGIAGLAVAVAVGYAFYRTGLSMSLRGFFAVSSALLLLVAAGLMAHGVHEWQEAGLIPVVAEDVYDSSSVLPQDGLPGGMLRALFGYADSPALLEVIAYFGYLVPVSALWLRRSRPEAPGHSQPAAA